MESPRKSITLPRVIVPHSVLAQREMEKRRSPLVSVPPLRRGFSRHRYDHQAIPQHGCVPAEPASVSPGKIIVAPPRPFVSTSSLPVNREELKAWESCVGLPTKDSTSRCG